MLALPFVSMLCVLQNGLQHIPAALSMMQNGALSQPQVSVSLPLPHHGGSLVMGGTVQPNLSYNQAPTILQQQQQLIAQTGTAATMGQMVPTSGLVAGLPAQPQVQVVNPVDSSLQTPVSMVFICPDVH